MQRIDDIVKRTIAAGGEALIGGQQLDAGDAGAFYEPTILTRVASDMEAVREEIFGPVLTAQTFDDEEEGLQLASHPAMAGSRRAYGRHQQGIARGTAYQGRHGMDQPLWPHRGLHHSTGGYQSSGIGRIWDDRRLKPICALECAG
jgi:aldehyde dehydrogenase (NAD+)